MEIASIPENNIINMANMDSGKIVSNFLLHGLKIRNNSDHNVTLKEISFQLYSSDILIKEIVYRGEALSNKIKRLAASGNWLDKGFSAKLYFGEDGFWNHNYFAESVDMNPKEETGILKEFFIIISEKIIDKLIVQVNYLQRNKELIQQHTIPVIQYENKNQYILPLKGSISTCGNYNTLPGHRQHYSMEFAFDMAMYNTEQKLCYKEDMHDEDYVIYGKDILAIADGEVADCYHSFTITTSWNWEERKPYIDKYGLAAQCGNYIVLKHDNGEYSFYGHLMVNSLTVKKEIRLRKDKL